jgi:hypothetical protein
MMGDSNHPNRTVLARELHAYLRWRNVNARHPDVLAAQRRERARTPQPTTTTLGPTPTKSSVLKPRNVHGHRA